MWDIAATLFSVFIAVLVIADGLDRGVFSDSKAIVVVVLSIVSIILLWWRRRWPIAVALALALPTIFTDAVGGAELVAIYTMASRRSWQASVPVSVLHLAASLVFAGVFMDGEAFLSAGILSLALLSIPLTWGFVVKARREVIDSLRERAERAEAAALERADRVRGQERERIAREMHDALAHRISMVSLHAGALEVRVDADRAEIETIAATIRASAHGALDDLREILGVLRSEDDSPLMRPTSGIGDIPSIVEEVRAVGVVVDYRNDIPVNAEISATSSRTMFRVVQEGLTNTCKHAVDTAVLVRLWTADEYLRVSLTNALGTRPTEVPGAHSGLIGLTERVTLAGGRLEYGLRFCDGLPRYVLEAWLPWPG
ncbi:histidine kinase [Rhodococcus sp. G-MC3]|nr:histidine kinase [Rhodococcus sp. G-MC3]